MRTIQRVLIGFAPADDMPHIEAQQVPRSAKGHGLSIEVWRRRVHESVDAIINDMTKRNMVPFSVGSEEFDIVRHKEMDAEITG